MEYPLLYSGSTNKAIVVSHVSAEPPDLFFVMIPNLKTEFIYLKEREFYFEFQVFWFFYRDSFVFGALAWALALGNVALHERGVNVYLTLTFKYAFYVNQLCIKNLKLKIIMFVVVVVGLPSVRPRFVDKCASAVKRLDTISPKLLIMFDARLGWCSLGRDIFTITRVEPDIF